MSILIKYILFLLKRNYDLRVVLIPRYWFAGNFSFGLVGISGGLSGHFWQIAKKSQETQ